MNWTPDSIKDLLANNPRAVERAILVLFARQTADEQAYSVTHNDNSRGFSAAHASKGSYYARWIQSGRNLTGHHLENARRITSRYTRQLLEEIQLKAAGK